MDYKQIRKVHIMARVEQMPFTGRGRRADKEEACREFDQFIQDQRNQAVLDYKLTTHQE